MSIPDHLTPGSELAGSSIFRSRPNRHGLLANLFLKTCLGLALCFPLPSAFANNPGGFTNTVTKPVTTGTEAFGSRTDHFLDNGILHVLIADSGNVDSIKYLKPGSPGTPKANGIEMVSQSGTNFGNHTAIYYWFYPDTNGGAVYQKTTGDANHMEVTCVRTYKPGTHKVVADIELHYALGKGNSALYVYSVVRHPAAYAIHPDLNISFIQCIFPTAHDSNNFLCENQYLDDGVKWGLSLNGVQQKRNGLQPNFYDGYHTIPVPGMPGEIVQYTTGIFAGQINGKYSYTFDYPTIDAYGMASDVNDVGLWVVTGSHEYQNNGPTACEYAGGIGGMTGFEPIIAHYENTGLSVSASSEWTKVYGPWAFYFNSFPTGAEAWQDAKNQAVAERQAWPYSWLSDSNYQPKNQRATVTGKLVIQDALRPGASAAGAWVGLAAPDAGIENAPDNWQFQSDAHQYWVRAAADGTFTIPNIQTFSPYGGPAVYQLYAYSAGTSTTTGAVGEFSMGPVPITSGSTTDLGTVTWNVPHLGASQVFEIGIPDRTAAEFRHGDEYSKPGLWTQFAAEFTNPLEYNTADNNWATALNYCHSVDNLPTSPWKWHLNFNLTEVIPGTYYLNIAYAAPNSVQIIRVNNDSTALATFTPTNGNTNSSAYLRQGIHTKYSVAHIAIPSSSLVPGANTITLDHEYHSNHGRSHFMYDYINLEAPAPPVLPPGRNLTWKGGVSSNAWDTSVANWLPTPAGTAVPYADGDRLLFDDTGSNNPSATLSGTMTPGRLTFSNVTKNHTLTGTGTLHGPMQLLKTGTGTLTISPTQTSLSCTTISGANSAAVTSSSGLVIGMAVSGTGIPSGTTLTGIDGTTLTFSKNATVSGTATLTFATHHPFIGGASVSGTVVLANDAANTSGLGTGPVTFNGGTIRMYENSNTYNSSTWNMIVPIGSSGTLKADPRVDLYGSLSGGGTFDLYVPWVRTTLLGNWAPFSGLINVTTDGDGGDFRIYNSNGYFNASIHFGPKVKAYARNNATATYPIGALSGDPAAILSGINNDGTPGAYTATWRVGSRNTDATFAGSIVNGTSPSITAITKVGSGTWTLSGVCSYRGPTSVQDGTLRITGSGSGSAGLEVGVDGTVELADGQLAINGPVTNNGTIRLTGRAVSKAPASSPTPACSTS